MGRISLLVIFLLFGCDLLLCKRSGVARNHHTPAPQILPSTSLSRPSATHPSPASLSHPGYHPAPAHPAYRPPAFDKSTVRPIGFQTSNPSSPVGPPKQSAPLGSAPGKGGTATVRPIGFVTPGSGTHGSGTGAHLEKPVQPPKASAPLGNSGSVTVRPIGFNTGANLGNPVGPPEASAPLGSSGSVTVRPIGFNTGTNQGNSIGPPKSSAPLENSASVTTRPIGFNPGVNLGNSVGPPKPSAPLGNNGSITVRPIGFNTGPNPGKSVVPPKASAPLGNSAKNQSAHNSAGNGISPSYRPPAYNQGNDGHPPTYTQGNYGQSPAYSPGGHQSQGYQPGGSYHPQSGYHPQAGYQPQGGYHTQGGGGGATIINNNNNHHYGGRYHPQGATIINNNNNHHHGGGYHSQGGGGGVTIINNNNNNHHYGGGYGGSYGYGGFAPSYHYSSHDTGSGTLGFYLGYSLGRLNTPSYHYHSSYQSNIGYTPVYDHYEVHHYYHNKENVPKVAEIRPNTIVGCLGDSGSFCPAGTTSLCTNDGAVMCVASATSTVPCTDQSQTNCIKSTVPCLNSSAPGCIVASQNTTTVSLPCISTAKIFANVTYVNNTLVIANMTQVDSNATVNASSVNTTMNGTTIANTTAGSIVTTTESAVYTTTFPNPTIAVNTRTVKQDPPQEFCVTILALPAVRKPTVGDTFFSASEKLFGQFALRAFGID
ncbi:hypothetical protein JTB14_037647 [Gonioctena quinquepunctata]|nr:hypothetical protein JTB14_037647 [Gonioctena quinquepunctata]